MTGALLSWIFRYVAPKTADGSIDTALYRDYLAGASLVTMWDCTPTTNDEDDRPTPSCGNG
ncbi:hypothetical protein AB0M72_31490 [Nocardiopsis dassonvillei]